MFQFTLFRRAWRVMVSALSSVAILALYVVPMSGVAYADPAHNGLPEMSVEIALVDEEVTVTTGDWSGNGAMSYAYEWFACDASANCDSTGDTDNAFTPNNSLRDGTLSVQVTATDDDGTSDPVSAGVIDIVKAPTNSTPPWIIGAAVEGTKLDAAFGVWNASDTVNHPLTYTYQWQRCTGVNCANIAGSDANDDADYTVDGLDIGKQIRVVVTATNDGGTGSKTSTRTDAVAATPPVNTVAPVITGTYLNGEELLTTEGTWLGTGNTFEYQWRRCDENGLNCADIVGTDGSDDNDYRLTSDDINATIRARVTATNGSGSDSANSASTATIGLNPPVSIELPVISGTLGDGNELTTTDGTWDGIDPITYSYQWLRCDWTGNNCEPIAGGDANDDSDFTLTTDDIDSTIRVEVTAENVDGDSTASSNASALVSALAPENDVLPALGGSLTRGDFITVSDGNWYGSSPITFEYQWRRCSASGLSCSDIEDATNSIHQLDEADIGHRLRAIVTALNGGGATQVVSAASAIITASVPSAPAAPTVTLGNASAQVTFDDEETYDGGGPITGYTAQCELEAGGGAVTQTGAGSPIAVTGLVNGETYVCRVLATNSTGDGSYSSDSDPFTPTNVPATVPDAPTITSIDHGDESIIIEFEDGDSDGGSEITGYTATCTSDDDVNSPITSEGEESPITVHNLMNGLEYECTVYATNAEGDSDESDPEIDTPNVVPDAPQKPTVEAGVGAIEVNFEEPENGGTEITGYRAECESTNGGTDGFETGFASPLTIEGLTNGKSYTCAVRAQNAEGNGQFSEDSDTVLVAAAPTNSARPSLSGRTLQQRSLTGSKGSWTAVPAPSFAYRWQRCNAAGAHCVNIAGAKKTTYKLTKNDVGKKVRFVVVASNVADHLTKTSLISAKIRPVPQATSGAYYYDGSAVKKAGAGAVGVAVHGNARWVAYAGGVVSPPTFGQLSFGLAIKLKKPIIGIKATPSGKGYWLFASDGGVFTFGDARYFGSTGAMKLNAPIVAMETTPNGKGYWLFAADGGVFTFGNAKFYGSTGSLTLHRPVVAMLATNSGKGYWLVTSAGRAYRFGDAVSIPRLRNANRTDVVGLVSTGNGFRFMTKSLQLIAP